MTHLCSSCGLQKSKASFSRNQLGKGTAARCLICVSGSLAANSALSPMQWTESPQGEDDFCQICRCHRHESVRHDSTKRHLANLSLSSKPGYVCIAGLGLSDRALQRVGVDKGVIWVTTEQMELARSCRTVAETGIALARFKSFRPFVTPSMLCTQQEAEFAASLINVRGKGLQDFHFTRALQLGMVREPPGRTIRMGTSGYVQQEVGSDGWCTPAELDAAIRYKGMCTILVSRTGLEASRFRKLGIQGDWCSQQDVENAMSLIDARKPKPGSKYAVPLGYYDRDSSDSDSDSSDSDSSDSQYSHSQKRHRRPKAPIWVTLEEHEAASDRWDAAGIAYDIDTQWGSMPMGGAYKDSMRYPEDGFGGYMGEGFGY